MKKHVPTKQRSTKYHQPWINPTINRLVRKKQRAWRKAKRTQKPADWDRYNHLNKNTRRENRKAYQSYVRSFIEEESGKHLWKFVKRKKTDNVGIAPLKKNGVMYSTTALAKKRQTFLMISLAPFLQKRTLETSQISVTVPIPQCLTSKLQLME